MNRIFFLSLVPKQHCINYLHSIDIALGIISNLEIIWSTWKDHINCMQGIWVSKDFGILGES